jgi:hypothetical protein
MTVSRGDDLPNKARELAHHFSTQGTPIMIGTPVHRCVFSLDAAG